MPVCPAGHLAALDLRAGFRKGPSSAANPHGGGMAFSEANLNSLVRQALQVPQRISF